MPFKKYLSRALYSLFVVVSIFSIFKSAHATGFGGAGSGTSIDPYVITTCSELQDINLNLDAYYVLGNDIDCSTTNPSDPNNDTSRWNDSKGFDPIGGVSLLGQYVWQGFSYTNFTGTLDGQNHKITNLYINRGANWDDPDGYYVGLFGTIASGAEVKNLTLENVDITALANEVGSLAGGLSGTVTNVHATGSVHGSGRVGGLVGVHVDSNNFPNSSPLVYSWNGSKYTYTDDVGGILPKTLSGIDIAQIDAKDVAPKDGKYSFKVAEEYNEIVYYDEMALMTFDHQPGYDVVEPLNRTAGVNDLRTVSKTPTHPLVSCVDDQGQDCLDALRNYDDKWSYTNVNGVYDKKNLKKYWILDFGDLSNATDTELILRGARDYSASAQYPGNTSRSIQVKDANGNWVEVYNKNQIGSDGSPRLRTINMTGKFLSHDYRIKVSFDTFNANYFAVDTSSQVPFTAHTYHPDSADLSFHGFTDIDHTYYFNHNYDKVSPLPSKPFKNQYGYFTKYGDVTPLLNSPDDHYVIMRYGDQLSVDFEYDPIPDGMERSFMLYNDAVYKHATNDSLGVLGQSAGYLPYHGMTKYALNMTPYPQTPENLDYMNTWNTRYYPGPFADALRTASSTIIDSDSSVNVWGTWIVGGLVGYNEKEIRRSFETGNVNAGSSWYVGGLVGENSDGGTIGWIHDSYARGNVTGGGYVGGLVGYNYAKIERDYSTGQVNGGYTDYTHGLVGINCDGCGNTSVTDSFWDTETSGLSGDNAGTGKTTAEMKDIFTFTNQDTIGLSNAWDFTGTQNNDAGTDDIWKIDTGNDGYPYLSWQTVVPAPEVTNINVVPGDATSTITWTTDATSSSKILYSVHDSGYASTNQYDTSPRVYSHSVTLQDLIPCTTYFFKIYSQGSYSNSTTTNATSFTTTGCTAETSPDEKTLGNVDTTTNATTTLDISEGSKYFTVVTAPNFTSTSTSVVVQIKTLGSDLVLGSIGKPVSGLQGAGSVVFDVKALINATTTLDSFDLPVTISYHYSDADIAGLNESTLTMYHYHDGAWSQLDSCIVDTGAHIITCTTPSFSVFALFGQPIASVATPSYGGGPSGGGGGTVYGCKDPKASNYSVGVANDPSQCIYSIGTSTIQTYSSNQVSTSSMSVGATTLFKKDLYVGMTHPDIKRLQIYLNTHGYLISKTGPGSLGHETTKFGPSTQKILIKFQKDHQILPASGAFGPRTRAFVNKQ